MAAADRDSFPGWPPGRSTLRKLSQKKYRQRWGVYLLEGAAMLRDASLAGAPFVGILADDRIDDRESDRELFAWFQEQGVPTERVASELLSGASELATPPPLIGVLHAQEAEQPTPPPPGALVLALDRVSDPGNVGTLLRAAAFYGLDEVWLGSGCAERYNPKVLRAAMSAHLHLKIHPDLDLAAHLRRAQQAGVLVYAADAGAAPLPSRTRQQEGPGAILLLGNEPHGIAAELLDMSDYRLGIERIGPVDSLNVAMAGVVLLDRIIAGRTAEGEA